MNIFIAGTETFYWIHERMQKEEMEKGGRYSPLLLMSFYYAKNHEFENIYQQCDDFLLDSGAFTFMRGKGRPPEWEKYIEEYAAFINKYDISKFFELDIDPVVGYEKVKLLRKKLENLTGRKSIPVWHINRGMEEFEKSCREYPYVAIGGLTNGVGQGEYARKLWRYFPWFINTAHKNGAKIHALGFTSFEGMRKYHFDSIDSTSWTEGHRYKWIDHFDGKRMTRERIPKGFKMIDPKEISYFNYSEWYKLQKYAKIHL